MNFDLTKITNPEAKRFFTVFTLYRKINREFFELVPEEQFDFRMVENENVKSDSVRESLAHMINLQRSYIIRCKNEKGDWKRSSFYDQSLKTLSKSELLAEHDKAYQELYKFICSEDNCSLLVEVPWSKEPVTAIKYLWGMNDHEIFHNGWNVAVMDHLGIERFESLKQMWG